MTDILEKIVSGIRPALADAKRREPEAELIRRAAARPVRGFAESIRRPGRRVIAELKKASPSKGLICPDFRFLDFARELENAGAAALSVLTERNYFLGGLENLRAVSAAVSIPVLRKDFLFDPYQIYEARAEGADAVLLIAALLPDRGRLAELAGLARSLGMDVLGEAHDAAEVELLLDTPVTLIGVNARDLRSFHTDLGVTASLLGMIPRDRLPVAESAIRTREEIAMLQTCGAAGFLIGETLMRAASPGAALKELLA